MLIKRLLPLLFLFAGFKVIAALMTTGTLESNDDGSTNLITDTVVGETYLRLDVVDEFDLAGTLSAIGAGGLCEGFSIASVAQRNSFLAASNAGVSGLVGDVGANFGPAGFAWYGDYTARSVKFVYVQMGIAALFLIIALLYRQL
jgi:hypothetical protein